MANSASLNQIAFNLLNLIRGGISSNQEPITLEQIKFTIKYYRSLFIRRDMERNNNRFRMFEQDLGVIEVDQFDTAEDIYEESLVEVLRTVSKIPTPIRMKNWEGITFVGSIDKQGRPIPIVDGHRSYWSKFNKYTRFEPEAYYRNGYIYIRNCNDLDMINIRGVFEDPEQVFEFVNDNGLDLYDDNSPFPISTDMIQGITQGLISGELQVMGSVPKDETSDRTPN